MTVLNETIKKLTSKEIGSLGLYDQGIYTYKGVAKSRVKGLKTTFKTDSEIHYESEFCRWEVIKTADDYDGHAIRCFNKVRNEYETFYEVLIGCNFMK